MSFEEKEKGHRSENNISPYPLKYLTNAESANAHVSRT